MTYMQNDTYIDHSLIVKHDSVSMLDFKLHLYKLGIYNKVKELVYNSDFLIILAWTYQQNIDKSSYIYMFIKDAMPNPKLRLENIMQTPINEIKVSAIQLRAMLYQQGIYDDIDNYLNNLNDLSSILWNHSSYFSLSSDIIKLITEKTKWPDGKPLTDNDMQELFEDAAKLQF